jgi:hypothetical protein
MNILMSFSALGGAVLPFLAGVAIIDQRITSAYLICMLATLAMLAIHVFVGKRRRI